MSTKTQRRLLYCDVACCRHIQLSVTTHAAATAAAAAADAAAAAAAAAAHGADGSGCGGVKACVGRISCNGNNIALQSWQQQHESKNTSVCKLMLFYSAPGQGSVISSRRRR